MNYQELEKQVLRDMRKRKRQIAREEREVVSRKKLMQPDGSWKRIFDSNTGAWQQDSAIELDSVLTFAAVFACIRLIASDIGKLRIKLLRQGESGIWVETTNSAHSPVLRKPNSTQTRIKFIEQWIISKMIHGNSYILKGRDDRGVVASLRVLDPTRVEALVSTTGDVFYRLKTDHLAQVGEDDITVPAREMIHDVHMTPEHPLIGVSPIGACGLAAMQGLKIQQNSQKFFGNMSRPGGMLTAPGAIGDDTAKRLKADFEANYGGDNIGRIAVAGDGLEFSTFSMNASDSQLIEQLKWTAEDVCRAFGVPSYKVGVGAIPAMNNVEAMEQAYYSQTLQELIECVEILLDEGLSLPFNLRTEFNLKGLMRMDSMTRANVHAAQIGAGMLSPNEARREEDLPPVLGGDSPYLQQQNFSLSALHERDQDKPFSKPEPAPSVTAADESEDDSAERLIEAIQKKFQEAA